MKNKIVAIGTISVLVGVLLVNIAVLIYLMIWLGYDIWQTVTNPSRLSNVGREFLAMMGSLGVCCIGIVLLIVIISRMPPKWWHGGLESSGDDDPYIVTCNRPFTRVPVLFALRRECFAIGVVALVESLRGRMGESTRRVEGLFESLLEISFKGN